MADSRPALSLREDGTLFVPGAYMSSLDNVYGQVRLFFKLETPDVWPEFLRHSPLHVRRVVGELPNEGIYVILKDCDITMASSHVQADEFFFAEFKCVSRKNNYSYANSW